MTSIGRTSVNRIHTLMALLVGGTCGIHASHTTVQGTWRKATVLFASMQMATGAVDRL